MDNENKLTQFTNNTLSKLKKTGRQIGAYDQLSLRGASSKLGKSLYSPMGIGGALSLPTMLTTGINSMAKNYKRAPIVSNTFIQRSSQLKNLNMGIDPFVGVKFSTRNKR